MTGYESNNSTAPGALNTGEFGEKKDTKIALKTQSKDGGKRQNAKLNFQILEL